jgi:hypothetical protein
MMAGEAIGYHQQGARRKAQGAKGGVQAFESPRSFNAWK